MDQNRAIQTIPSFLHRSIVDLIVIGGLTIVVYLLVADLDLFERLHEFSRAHEDWELDEIVVAILFAIVGSFAFGIRRLQDQRREIKGRIAAENEAIRLSLIDPLTHLPNRRAFEQNLSNRLARVEPGDESSLALLIIDLDRFKPVNDSYGHSIGDEVLVAFAKRTSDIANSGEFFARLAGDEFGIILDAEGDDEPRLLADRLLSALQFPMQTESGTEISLGASIGIAVAPRDGVEPRLLFKHADDALYLAKANGRRNYQFYHAPPDGDAPEPERFYRAC